MSNEISQEGDAEETFLRFDIGVDLEGNQSSKSESRSNNCKNSDLICHIFKLFLQGSRFLFFFGELVTDSSLARILAESEDDHLTVAINDWATFENAAANFLVLDFDFTGEVLLIGLDCDIAWYEDTIGFRNAARSDLNDVTNNPFLYVNNIVMSVAFRFMFGGWLYLMQNGKLFLLLVVSVSLNRHDYYDWEKNRTSFDPTLFPAWFNHS